MSWWFYDAVFLRFLAFIVNVWIFLLRQAKKSNFRHRPIGLGVQGLADTFILMRLPFDSEEAMKVNVRIFETIYYAALTSSCELAEKLGPYETYQGSPVSKGVSFWGRETFLRVLFLLLLSDFAVRYVGCYSYWPVGLEQFKREDSTVSFCFLN